MLSLVTDVSLISCKMGDSMNSNKKPRKFWSPLVAGIGLGIALLGMFVVTKHGLGAYGFYKKFFGENFPFI